MPRGIPSNDPTANINIKLNNLAYPVAEFQAQLKQKHRLNFRRADVIRRLIADGLQANGVEFDVDVEEDED